MATTVKPRDLDLPASYSREYGAPSSYPTGSPRDRETAKKYAAYSRALWDEQDEYMNLLHQVWTQNLLFLSGRQWWTAGKDGVFKPTRMASWREKPTSNLTMAFFRNYLAKVLKNRPAWTVMPATSDPEDVHSAELGDQVLEGKWQELRLSRVLRSAVSWSLATGNGFLYPYWNSDTGKMVPATATLEVPVYDEAGDLVGMEDAEVLLDKDGEPQLLENGQPDPEAEPYMIDEGDVGVRSYSPFQVRVNPEAETDVDLTWMIIAEVRSIRDIARTNPDIVNEIIPESIDLAASMDRAVTLAGSLAGEIGSNLSPARDHRAEHLDRVLVLHYHEKPCEEYPGGRYWVATRDHLLIEPQELPEGIWPPIIHLEDVVIPGRYYASSVMEQVVPLNRHYNEINAQIKEHHNLMAKGKWLVPRGSGIKVGMITNAPGEVIQFNPGFMPTQAQIMPLPMTIVEERNRVMSDYQTVSGIHSVSMGKAPPGVNAGIAFLQLQEADDTDLGPYLTMLEEAVAELAGDILKIIKERYTTERLVYVVGENRKYQVRNFKGSDLRGASDVRAQAGSSFPWLKSAQQSMLITLAAQMPQVFTSPETGQFDTAKFARLLPIGGLGNIGNESDLDVQEALREEEMFSVLGLEGEEGNQEIPQVGFWQNHEIHYLQHARILKSATFRSWPQKGQQEFLKHVQITQQQKDAKAKEMAQMNAMAQGNAPKELYQQGGPGATAPPDLTEEEIAQMSPDEIAALDGMDDLSWLEEGEETGPVT